MFAPIRGGHCAPVAALLVALALPGVSPLGVARAAEPAAAAAAAVSPLEMLAAAKRICVLGDSITYDGRWVSALSAWMEAKGLTGDVIAVGLPSETCSGLSEEGHAGGQFPRPDVHERLARVLSVVKPDLVIACYGMNCGIYLPLDDTRFAAYKAGIKKLHDEVEKTGAKIIHLTPP
ncbi:MAG: lysophospholipase, partial [Planctomycetota bacterium]